MQLTQELEKIFGPLSKTLFFEYRSIEAVCGYFMEAHGEKLREILGNDVTGREETGGDETGGKEAPPVRVKEKKGAAGSRLFRTPAPVATFSAGQEARDLGIAIIGLSGRYPPARKTLKPTGENLREGRDCITEVPGDRWDWRTYYTEDRGSARGPIIASGADLSTMWTSSTPCFSISPPGRPHTWIPRNACFWSMHGRPWKMPVIAGGVSERAWKEFHSHRWGSMQG